MNEQSPVHRIFVALIALLVASVASLHAADAAKPAAGITQQLLNSIHITPKLILDPFPAYEQKFLPIAMAASRTVRLSAKMPRSRTSSKAGNSA